MGLPIKVNASELSNDDVKYSNVKVSSVGGKSVNILNKNDSKVLTLVTPLMLQWGVSDYEGDKKFSLSLQFPSKDYSNAEVETFLENMKNLEQKFKDDAVKNSKEWLGKSTMNSDVVDALWSPMLKYAKIKGTDTIDESKSPTMRIKVPTWEGNWKCDVFNPIGEPLFDQTNADSYINTPDKLIGKGLHIYAMIQCGGLWFINGKFGVTWRLTQAIVQPRESFAGSCQIKLDTSQQSELQTLTASKEVVEDEDDEVVATLAEDTDDEEEEEEEEKPLTPPPAPVKKKRVVKKKAVVAQEE